MTTKNCNTVETVEVKGILTKEIRTYSETGEILFYTRIEYDRRKKPREVFVKDHTDSYNEPSAFTRSIRWVDKVANKIEERLTEGEQITFKFVTDLFTEFEVRYHYYCAVD